LVKRQKGHAGGEMREDELFLVRLAATPADLLAAQRLRYQVFVEEMGADGPMVDHAARLECDEFDPVFDHLVLVDPRRDPGNLDHVIGVYRLLPGTRMPQIGRFYSASEYDLRPLIASGRPLLELGRSCVHADHRGGTAMLLMWNALADYVLEKGIEILFGTASFPGVDLAALAGPLSYLHHHHLAPDALRVTAHGAGATRMDILPPDRLDRRAAMTGTPALIKAYLRLGGFVGQGAYVDQAFNTTDICLVMDTSNMSARHRDFYTRKRGVE
jgi:L-ornithine Nalpha-acyltransferase